MKRLVTLLTMTMLSVNAFAASEKDSETAEGFDRGFKSTTGTFIPKGTVSAGINFSYNTVDLGKGSDDSGYSMLFGLLGGLQGTMFSFGVAPQVSYFVAENLSIGARFDYDRSFLNLHNASLSIGDDLGFNIQDYNTFQHKFRGSLTLRYYMPIGGSKRFGIFVEGRATGTYGQAKTWKEEGGKKLGTYAITKEGAINFVPGICVFATNNLAVEVAIGVLGLDYSRVDQYTNQVEHSVKTSSGANFRINPLSIELGTCVYLYTGHNKKAKKNKR